MAHISALNPSSNPLTPNPEDQRDRRSEGSPSSRASARADSRGLGGLGSRGLGFRV